VKTYVHLRQYLADCLYNDLFETNVVEKNKKHTFYAEYLMSKIVAFMK